LNTEENEVGKADFKVMEWIVLKAKRLLAKVMKMKYE
jgi:hypothetical protein